MALFDVSATSAVVMCLTVFASLAIAEGDLERGVRLAGAMAGLRDETGTGLVRAGVSTSEDIEPDELNVIHGEFAEVDAEAQAMSAEEAIAFALADSKPAPS